MNDMSARRLAFDSSALSATNSGLRPCQSDRESRPANYPNLKFAWTRSCMAGLKLLHTLCHLCDRRRQTRAANKLLRHGYMYSRFPASSIDRHSTYYFMLARITMSYHCQNFDIDKSNPEIAAT